MMNPAARRNRFYKLIGAALVIGALVIATAIVILPSYLSLGASTATSTGSVTSPVNVVENVFANHMHLLAIRNVSAIVSQFEGNANVTWTGQTAGLTGL